MAAPTSSSGSLLDQAKQALTRKVGPGKHKVPVWSLFAVLFVVLYWWRKRHAPAQTAQGAADTGVTSDQGSGSLGDYSGGGAGGGSSDPGAGDLGLPADAAAFWDPGSADGGGNYDANGTGYTQPDTGPGAAPWDPQVAPYGLDASGNPIDFAATNAYLNSRVTPAGVAASAAGTRQVAASLSGARQSVPAKRQTPSGVDPVRTIAPSQKLRVQNPDPVFTSHEAITVKGEGYSVPVTTQNPQVRVGSGKAID